jgi:small subunit ribosomal protein S21
MPRGDRERQADLERLLKRFRRELNESGQLRDYRRKRFFISKSEMVRTKKRKADRRRRRREYRIRERETRRRR